MLVVVTGAKVDKLIPLYAIGVFTSFTLSQAGHGEAPPHAARSRTGSEGMFVNGTGAVLSFIVDIIIAITKFTHGAWVIIILVPIMVYGLVRLNRQYESEAHELETRRRGRVHAADPAPPRRARVRRPPRPEHRPGDPVRPDAHARRDAGRAHRRRPRTPPSSSPTSGGASACSRVPLELVDCPDRRVARAALEVVAAETGDGQTEVSVLMPHRLYKRFWHRLLHDHTGDEIARVVGQLPHANVTMVPYHIGALAVPALDDPVA